MDVFLPFRAQASDKGVVFQEPRIDYGVRYATGLYAGLCLLRVRSDVIPKRGQYIFDGSVYTFSKADIKARRWVIIETAADEDEPSPVPMTDPAQRFKCPQF